VTNRHMRLWKRDPSFNEHHASRSAELHRTVQPHGHVYKLRVQGHWTFEWNLQAILDNSFAFLLESREKCPIGSEPRETMLAYLAGPRRRGGHIECIRIRGRGRNHRLRLEHDVDLVMIS